jgi:hypothetical protein
MAEIEYENFVAKFLRNISTKLCMVLCVAIIVAALPVPSCADTDHEDKWVKIINQRSSGFPIWAVYIRPAGYDDWGRDQLNGDTIIAGRSYKWTIPWDGCYVDIKAMTFTGLHTERYGVDVCGGIVWTLYDE